MDYSYLFRSAKIKKDSLEAAGFTTSDGVNYTMSPTVSGGAFRADIELSLTEQTLTVHLFDTATDFEKLCGLTQKSFELVSR